VVDVVTDFENHTAVITFEEEEVSEEKLKEVLEKNGYSVEKMRVLEEPQGDTM